MFHLDNNSGVSSMPTPAAAQNTSPRWFTEGAGSVPPSWPGQDWYNIVQAELLAVLAAAGIAPDKSKLNQLALAIKAISNKDALLKVNLLSEIKTVGASAQKTAIDNLGLTQTVELAASALQKDKNLSDVPDKPKARKNLELGSSAVNDVVTSMTDTTTGRVPIVGWMGLGNAGYGGLPMGVTSQFLSYPSSADEVPANCAGFQAAYGKTRRAQIVINTMGEVFSRFSLSDDVLDKTTPWAKHFTTLKPPTAADVSAIPFFGKIPAGTNLNTLTSYGVWFNPSNANATLALNYPSTNAGSLQVLQDAGSTQIYTEYQSGSQFRRGFYAGTWSPWRIVYDSGYKPTPDDVNAIAQDGCRVA
ncbi:pyocin knob domain-containing protein, partial [Hafnia sp.]